MEQRFKCRTVDLSETISKHIGEIFNLKLIDELFRYVAEHNAPNDWVNYQCFLLFLFLIQHCLYLIFILCRFVTMLFQYGFDNLIFPFILRHFNIQQRLKYIRIKGNGRWPFDAHEIRVEWTISLLRPLFGGS